jgi:hypothetical protein
VSDGSINSRPTTSPSERPGRHERWDPSGGALYFYNPAISTSTWIYSRQVVTVIGGIVLQFKHKRAVRRFWPVMAASLLLVGALVWGRGAGPGNVHWNARWSTNTPKRFTKW